MKYTSSLFDDVRNTLGSIVGSSSWSGSYIRIKNTQTSSRTATQAATRGQFKAHSKAWAALTPAQRTDWNSLAQAITKKDKLGNNYHPTGLQTFVSCNMLLQNLDGGTISTPPSIPDTPPTLASLTLTATVEVAAPHTQTLSITWSSDTSPTPILVGSTRGVGVGISAFDASSYRRVLATATGAPAGESIIGGYNALYGDLIIGSQISVSLQAVSVHGFASAIIHAATIVEAV